MTLREIADFCRLSLIGMALSAVTLGCISSGGGVSLPIAAGLAVVAAAFHVAVFVHNDLCDLSLDRTEPRRARFPLVTGRVSRRAGWLVVVGAAAVSIGVDAALGGDSAAPVTALVVGYAALACYNVAGKRTSVPYLTDLVQGVGWAALVVYGALRTAGTTPPTWFAAGYVVGYIVLVNGVHGGLRDLPNDHARRARTAAVRLGARPGPRGIVIPRRMRRYAWALQALLAAVLLAATLFEVAAGTRLWAVAALDVAFCALAAALLGVGLDAAADLDRFRLLGAAHLLVSFLPAAGIAAARCGPLTAILGFVVMSAPFMGNAWFRRVLLLPAVVRRRTADGQR